MGAVGRNEQCSCGSGRKSKRCCGVQRGPSEADLARAFLAGHVRPAARVLRGCTDDEFIDLEAEMIELPTIDTTLQLPLPRLLTPDVNRLLDAIEEGDLDDIDDAIDEFMYTLPATTYKTLPATTYDPKPAAEPTLSSATYNPESTLSSATYKPEPILSSATYDPRHARKDSVMPSQSYADEPPPVPLKDDKYRKGSLRG